jgi:hypothetical protein
MRFFSRGPKWVRWVGGVFLGLVVLVAGWETWRHFYLLANEGDGEVWIAGRRILKLGWAVALTT